LLDEKRATRVAAGPVDLIMSGSPEAPLRGQQQCIAIARSLAMDPVVISFNDPTSSLDPEMIGEVHVVMKALTG
jgi:ABC-type polar amino acid transport system ATPase subunit